MKIDVHAHMLERQYLESLCDFMGLDVSRTDSGQTLLRKGNATVAWFREDFFDQTVRLKEMDRMGIERRVLSLSSPSIYEWPVQEQIRLAVHINDATARYCEAHPDRFSGLATLPLGDTQAALAELDRAVNGLGLVGIAMGSHIDGKPLNDPMLEPVWSVINDKRLPVVEHPMRPLGTDHMAQFELPLRVGFVYETTTALTRMIYAGVFERYPDFPYIVAHTGGALLTILQRLDNGYHLFPACREHISRLPSEYAKRLYYDTCAFSADVIEMAHKIVGPERLLWGTDDPFISGGTDYIDALPIPDHDKTLIFRGNAARLFGLGT